jgi:peptidase E
MARHRPPQIIAMGGGGFSMEPRNPRLDDYVLRQSGARTPRVCFVGTASGDSDRYVAKFLRAFPARRARASVLHLFRRTVADVAAFLRAQDVVYVGGGNTVNLLAVWRAHGVDRAMRAAWRAGVVMTGVSAGALCWFEGGTTDSYGGLEPLHDGLGLVSGSVCPHYDGEVRRRPLYHAAVRAGLPGGWACDDGAAVHYVGRRFHAAVASRPGASVYRVERVGRAVVESVVPTRLLARGGD